MGVWCRFSKGAPRTSDVVAKLVFDTFEVIIRSRRDTAPGSDGVPWLAWQAAPMRTLGALYCSYEAALDGEPVPPDWGHSRIVLLPKSVVGAELGATSDAVRPSSLIKTAATAIACAVNIPLVAAAARMDGVEQHGFLRGRFAAQQASRQDDWMAAFWEHLRWWYLLSRIPDPLPSLCACRTAERCASHVCRRVGLLGARSVRFKVTSGARHGCPCSATLFVLALEPWLVMCRRALPFPACPWSAYADYLALKLRALFATLASAQPMLRILRLATTRSVGGAAQNYVGVALCVATH